MRLLDFEATILAALFRVVNRCITLGYADTVYIYARMSARYAFEVRKGWDYLGDEDEILKSTEVEPVYYSEPSINAAVRDLARAKGWSLKKARTMIERLINP